MLDDLEASARNRPATSVHAVPLAVIVAGFVVSRMGYYLAGVRFDADPLGRFWQFIDPELLRDRLFESLLYLHAQPPLFNLYLGVVIKLFPEHASVAFAASYLALGVTLAVTLYLLMAWMGVERLLAAALTLLFVVGPATVLYENWLFYTYPVTVLLCGAAVALAACAQDDCKRCQPWNRAYPHGRVPGPSAVTSPSAVLGSVATMAAVTPPATAAPTAVQTHHRLYQGVGSSMSSAHTILLPRGPR